MKSYPDQRRATTVKSTNIMSVENRVPLEERWKAQGHRSGILWLTGLPGSGKTTLSLELERRLFVKGYSVFVIDGDNVRHGLCADLGFSPNDRAENIRRVGEVAALFAQSGVIMIAAFISPYAADRDRIRATYPQFFHEIHVKADLATCERRDPKGHYAKARRGEIEQFTGVSAPYEVPIAPEFTVDTENYSADESVDLLIGYVARNFSISRK